MVNGEPLKGSSPENVTSVLTSPARILQIVITRMVNCVHRFTLLESLFFQSPCERFSSGIIGISGHVSIA